MIRSKGSQCNNAAECLMDSNRLLASYSVDCMFLTVFYAIYNTKTGHVTYCNAGHNPPHLLRANGTIEELPAPKNTIVGVTDGVTEAMTKSYEEFGTEGLDNILSGLVGKGSQEIIETVKAGIKEFVDGAEQSDDITMLVLKRK